VDFLSLDYRDPIYGVIILFALIFIISTVSYWWGIFKHKEEETNIKKFVKKFDQYESFDDYKEVIRKQDLPVESAILMALTFEKGGEYEKAIEIYLSILGGAVGKDKRKDILTLLGKTYYKAGFLKKSREILITALRLNPKNEEALNYLSIIHETLREYSRAIETLDVLEEMGSEVGHKKLYFKTLSIIHNKQKSSEKKVEDLKKLGLDNRIVQRKLFEFLKTHHLPMSREILKSFDFHHILDLLWVSKSERFEDDFIQEMPLLCEVFTAKGDLMGAKKSDIFELNVLIQLQHQGDKSADLSFSYLCNNCKNVFPLYFYRCPKCQQIDTTEIEINLIKKGYETGSFI
jgi:lipopolysaccharide biosynthesis regulator YciM